MLVVIIVAAYRHGNKQQAIADTDATASSRALRHALYACGAACVCVFVVAVYVVRRSTQQDQVRQESNTAQNSFESLRAMSHTIKGVSAQPTASGYDVAVTSEGNRDGEYRLHVNIGTIASAEQELQLTHGSATSIVSFSLQEFAEGYARARLRHDVDWRTLNILVDQTEKISAWLEPVLTSQEEASLPQFELQNIHNGFSSLRREAQGTISLSFRMTQGQVQATESMRTDF